MSPFTRRTVLHLSAVVIGTGFVGCLSGNTVADVSVWNDTDSKVTYDLSIFPLPDGGAIFSVTDTVAAGKQREYSDVIDTEGKYRINISVQGGPTETYEWKEGGEGTPDTDGISIEIGSDSIVFGKVQS